MHVGAIVPVKTFSRAKTRLHLSQEKTERICEVMLESVLQTISQSSVIEKTVVVSKDEGALKIARKLGAIEIYDENEYGVNNAVMLADSYFLKEKFDATIVFPQDIPLMEPGDIRTLFEMRISNQCVLVVPSKRFDGTNALFRAPPNIIETHYDEDSYKIHLNTAEKKSTSSALALIGRIMLDIDYQSDLYSVLPYSDLEIVRSIKQILDY
jgi:2-phospho-L-lactate guanylyltransferase